MPFSETKDLFSKNAKEPLLSTSTQKSSRISVLSFWKKPESTKKPKLAIPYVALSGGEEEGFWKKASGLFKKSKVPARDFIPLTDEETDSKTAKKSC